MRLALIAVGRARDAPVDSLVERYAERLPWPFELVTVAAKAGDRDTETQLLLDKVPTGAALVALDERGSELDSRGFASRLQAWRLEGRRATAFLVGGADGLGEAAFARADLRLALGRMTWPHQLVRILLAEQLYRATTILQGHPYHRD